MRRGLTTSLLVALAIVVAAGLMAVLSTQAIMASSDCAEHPVLANVAVSNDIAPAVQKAAQYFNRLHREINGHCAVVQVTEELPATAAAQIDGTEPQHGMPPIDAWIPDSTLWVNQARAMPQGAQVVQPTGVHVAMSPLMIVMPQTVAASLGPVAKSIGWNFLLPQTAGGPPAADGVKVELPDPKLSAAGLATVIEVNRLLGTGQAAGENFTRFAFGADETEQYDNPAALTSLIALSNPPLNERTVTVASEQSVIQFDQTHPKPLAARYPSDGSPELDYPYVLTTTNNARLRAAQEFGKILSQAYTASVVRYAGFRSADNVGARTPDSYGLDSQPLSVLPLGGPNTATVTLQAWDRVRIGIRILVIIDTSGSMATRSSPAGPTQMQELVAAASEGLLLFPQSTVMGLWEFNNNLDGTKPYKVLVPVGPLNAELGLISRREQIQQLNQTFAPRPGATDQAEHRGPGRLQVHDQDLRPAVLQHGRGDDRRPGRRPRRHLQRAAAQPGPEAEQAQPPRRPAVRRVRALADLPGDPAAGQRHRRRGLQHHRPGRDQQGLLRLGRPRPFPLTWRSGPRQDRIQVSSDSPARRVNHLAGWRVIFTRPGESGAPGLTFFRWPGCAGRS